MSWGFLEDNQEIRPPGGADATVWLWIIVSDDGSEQRSVEVWVSGSAMSSTAVPPIVFHARESQGQDAVARVLDWDRPPDRIKLFTDSDQPVYEGGDPGSDVRELNGIAEWFDEKGISLVFTARGIGAGPTVSSWIHSANLIHRDKDELVGRAEAPARLEAARKAKSQWINRQASGATATASAPIPTINVESAELDRLRQFGIHLLWSRPNETDPDSGWMIEAYDDDANLLDIAVQKEAQDALLTIIDNLLPPEG